MNKGDLINYVQEHAGLGKTESEKAVNAVFEGFGSFVVVERSASEGRNPRTGEKLQIPTKNQVKFRPGKSLKESVGG